MSIGGFFKNLGQGALHVGGKLLGDVGGALGTRDTPQIDPNGEIAKRRQYLQGQIDQRQAPTMQAATIAPTERATASQAATSTSAGTQVDQSGQAANQGRQNQVSDLLMNRVQGNAPSVAEMQFQKQTGQNIRQLAGSAATLNRGGAAGSNVGQILRAQNNAAAAAAGGAAQLRAEEQQAAEGQLAGLTTSARQQDIGLATTNANLGQQNQQFNAGQENAANQFNANAQTNTSQFNANQGNVRNARQAEFEQQAAANNQQADVNTFGQKVAGNQNLLTNQTNVGEEQAKLQKQQDTENTNNFKSVATKGAQALAFLSDKRAKEDVSDGDRDVDEALKKLRAKNYTYKGGEELGERTGVMADDLEKSKAGSEAVRRGPGGMKMIDPAGSISFLLASVARLDKKIDGMKRG